MNLCIFFKFSIPNPLQSYPNLSHPAHTLLIALFLPSSHIFLTTFPLAYSTLISPSFHTFHTLSELFPHLSPTIFSLYPHTSMPFSYRSSTLPLPLQPLPSHFPTVPPSFTPLSITFPPPFPYLPTLFPYPPHFFPTLPHLFITLPKLISFFTPFHHHEISLA